MPETEVGENRGLEKIEIGENRGWRMNNKMNILGKSYSEKDLQLITGKKDVSEKAETIPEEMLLLCEIIEDPQKLPQFLETFHTLQIKNEKAFHFSLLRVQVDSDLKMHHDLQKYQQRKYVAEILEKLLYGELMLSIDNLGSGEE